MLKRRFPYLVHMRVNFKNAVKVIMCCVVLHNMTITWRDEMSKDINDPDEQQQPQVHVNEYYDRPTTTTLGECRGGGGANRPGIICVHRWTLLLASGKNIFWDK